MVHLKPVQRTRAADTITEQILALIRSGKLKPGDKLPSEAELMQQTGLGRPSVRSALHSLEALNIIEIRQGVGAFVREVDIPLIIADVAQVSKLFSRRSIIEAIVVRRLLEPEIAAAAAKEATKNDLKRLYSALQALDSSSASPQYPKSEHTAFHLGIAELTHNILLTRIEHFLLSLWEEGLERAFHLSADNRGDVKMMYSDHCILYEAIAAGNSDLAHQRMLEHISITRDRISQLGKSAPIGSSQDESKK